MEYYRVSAMMKSTRYSFLFAGAMFVAACALGAELGQETAAGFGGFHSSELSALSDRHTSRMGAVALKMPSVTWVHGESDHFHFHFERGFLCQQFAIAAELFYGRIKEHLGIVEDSYERKGRIFVFIGTNSWEKFSSQVKLEKWTGAFQSENELFVTARANQTLDLSPEIPHEITHLVVKRFVGDVPLWLNEGIAEFEGARQRTLYLRTHVATKRFVIPPNYLPREQIIPLTDLTGMVDYPEDETKVEIFYTESELLVHYLYVECGGQERFLKFVKLQSQGLKFASSLDRIYGEKFRDLETFEESFAKYAASKTKSR